MNTTDSSYFTFNVDNSILLLGDANDIRSDLVTKVLCRMADALGPDNIQFVFFDMTQSDFMELKLAYPNSVAMYETDPEICFIELARLADLAVTRAGEGFNKPMIVLAIEENDMACLDQGRFDAAMIKLNSHAQKANMKTIFATSRPAPDVISLELRNSFDLILASKLQDADCSRLMIEQPKELDKHLFTVTSKN